MNKFSITTSPSNTYSDVLPSLTAGACSGFVNHLVGYPFLNITTRRSADHSTRFSSTWQCVVKTIREEGISALYKGGMTSFLTLGFVNSINFSVYSQLRSIIQPTEIPQINNIFAGAATGLVAAHFYAPINLVQVNLMLQYAPKENPFRTIVRGIGSSKSPLRSLYRILPVSLLVHGSGTGFYYGGHDFVKGAIYQFEKRNQGAEGTSKLISKILTALRSGEFSVFSGVLGGMVGGSLHWCVSMPFWAIQTRQVADIQKFPTVLSAAKYIYSNYGPIGFYRGLTPALIRAIPTHSAVFLTFDFVENFVKTRLKT